MKYKHQIFLLLVTITSSSFISIIAQNDYLQYTNNDDTVSVMRYSLVSNDYLPGEIIGTPFENEIFQEGTLFENNQPVISKLFFRYNVYQEIFEIKRNFEDDDSKIATLKKTSSIVIEIKNDLYFYNENSESYFQILFIGNNYKLLKKSTKTFFKAKRASNSFDRDMLATFKDNSSYYLVDKSDVFHEVPSSKNKKLKFFGNKKDDIKKYVSNNNLDINNEVILIKVVRYFDSFNDASLQ